MKSIEGVMEILAAFDLTDSVRGAAELSGCSHHTVARYVSMREHPEATGAAPTREGLIDGYVAKVEEWVDQSHGKIRADVVHEKLLKLGYTGSERTTRRAVRRVKEAWKLADRRVYRPWIPEPGMWFQWDWGWGPKINGRQTYLYCAWLAWSKFRVVIPAWDKTLPTVVRCLDRTLRAFGGSPTYGLTDNEKTVTLEHVAGLPVRNPKLLEAARHYGLSVATCMPADPETKGGSEATVKIAKADLVPTEANLREGYERFADLEEACAAFCDKVNGRTHRTTRRRPVEMLAEEREHLHPVPAVAYTVVFGQTRVANWCSLVSFGSVPYSVPYHLRAQTVWVREEGDEIVVIHVDSDGPKEVARHERSTPGNPRVNADHYPPGSGGPLMRQPRAANEREEAFLAIGEGARSWLVEAAAAGVHRLPTKIVEVLAVANLYGAEAVDRALAAAAAVRRFDTEDLPKILDYQRGQAAHGGQDREGTAPPPEVHSLQPGTAVWRSVR
jgi:transposase